MASNRRSLSSDQIGDGVLYNYDCHSDIQFSLLWLKWRSAKVKSERSTKLQHYNTVPTIFHQSSDHHYLRHFARTSAGSLTLNWLRGGRFLGTQPQFSSILVFLGAIFPPLFVGCYCHIRDCASVGEKIVVVVYKLVFLACGKLPFCL